MGNGGGIPRALRGLALCALLFTGACVDFAEPNIPSLGAPAVLSLTVRQLPNQPLDVTGSLSAGREVSGVRRAVTSPLVVAGTVIEPGEPNAQGAYIFNRQILRDTADFEGPFDIGGPAVAGVSPPASVRWFGIRKLDPDTVRVDERGDVELHVETEFPGSFPENRLQQWFLELRGDLRTIRVSGDGQPPPVLRIPSQFIPATPDGQAELTLIYIQSTTVAPPAGDYISSISLDVRLQWILRTK